MRLVLDMLVVLGLIASTCAAQPTTVPASAPVEPMTLDGGKLTFAVPAGLTFTGKRDDDCAATFSVGDNRAAVALIVTLQPQAVPEDFPAKLAELLGKRVREEAAAGTIDIVMAPRVIKDPGMLLRIHDKYNTEERFGDRAQMFRTVGLYLVSVVATAYVEDEAEAKRVHELGAELLQSVR